MKFGRKRENVQNQLSAILFVVDSSNSDSIVHIVCDYRITMAHLLHRQRWFHQKRSTDTHRRTVCRLFVSHMHLAYHATCSSLYQTHSAEANHTDFVDGADLCYECGSYQFVICIHSDHKLIFSS